MRDLRIGAKERKCSSAASYGVSRMNAVGRGNIANLRFALDVPLVAHHRRGGNAVGRGLAPADGCAPPSRWNVAPCGRGLAPAGVCTAVTCTAPPAAHNPVGRGLAPADGLRTTNAFISLFRALRARVSLWRDAPPGGQGTEGEFGVPPKLPCQPHHPSHSSNARMAL